MMIYMKVSRDKYELPVEWAESMGELARRCGVDVSTISAALKRIRTGKGRRSKYIEVWLDDVHKPQYQREGT